MADIDRKRSNVNFCPGHPVVFLIKSAPFCRRVEHLVKVFLSKHEYVREYSVHRCAWQEKTTPDSRAICYADHPGLEG